MSKIFYFECPKFYFRDIQNIMNLNKKQEIIDNKAGNYVFGDIEQNCSERAKAPIDLINKDKKEEIGIIPNDKSVNESLQNTNQVEEEKSSLSHNEDKKDSIPPRFEENNK